MAKPVVTLLLLAMATPALADDPPKLQVTPPADVAGTGRTAASITVTGAPPITGKPLPVPDVARVTCTGATALASTGDAPPAILVSATTTPTKLQCTATQNGAEATFTLGVKPPPAGLYATVSATDVQSSARDVSLQVFSWDGKQRGTVGTVRAAASMGTVTAKADKLALSLSGNAPRTIAIAFASGTSIGAAFVPVTGNTVLPVESEPGASVEVWIAGHWFGPVKTKGKIANVPVQVPAGITTGVARSTGKAGYVTDAVTDLKIPTLPRIAALFTRERVHVEDPATIAVAIAGKDGRPGATTLAVTASAKRGRIGTPKPLGPGLWAVPYTAPATPGADHVTIHIDDDKAAGTAELDVDIAAGNVAKLTLDAPKGSFEPGAPITTTAHAYDANGNPVPDALVTATLGGESLSVTPGEPLTISGQVPEKLPSGELVLEVSAGSVRQHATISAGGKAASARVDATIDGRTATTDLAILDRFGNLAPEGTFEVSVDGGALGSLERHGRSYRAVIHANPGVARARVTVRAGDQILVTDELRFEPPASAVVLGAWASGGWTDNRGILGGPHGGLGLVLRRNAGPIELGLVAGVDAIHYSDTTQLTVDGMTRDASQSISTLGGQFALRARVRLTRRLGLAATAGLVPMRAHVTFDGGASFMESYDEVVIGKRAQLHVDVRLGPGRLLVGGTYGRAKLVDGAVVGQIDGASALVGYEWWFADFGW